MRTFILAATLALAASSAQAAILVTYEAPGVQNTTAAFDYVGVETFESRTLGFTTFQSDFGTAGLITGDYTGQLRVDDANQFGSAGGVGKHAAALTGQSYSIDLATTDPKGINYFGYWLSALDSRNFLEVYKGGNLVFTFDPATVLAAIGNKPAYFCNPNPPANRNCGEPYAFVNIFSQGDTFDRVVIRQAAGGAIYESDNHTVGYYTDESGTPLPAPGALALTGLGLAAVALRRR